ncbi:MAG: LuxR C-terminal-related transcriptional regulator [Novosphingobium sp.]
MFQPVGRTARNSAYENLIPGTVLVLDPVESLRSQTCTVLRSAGYRVDEYLRASDMLNGSLPGALCCIVASVGTAKDHGPSLIERLSERGEPLPVIFVSDRADVLLSVRSMKAGAVDFLPRPFAGHDLLDAVTLALQIDAQRRSVARVRQAVAERFDTLTRREQQVMDGVVRGLMNKQIAWELQISEITVKLHRSSLMRKMELRSVPDLVRASMSLAA